MVKFFSSKIRFWPSAALTRLAGMFFAVFALVLGPTAQSAPKFEATIDRSSISMGESVTLTLSFTDCSPEGQPSLPQLPGLKCVGTSTSQQTVMNNGQINSTVSYAFEMRPLKEGSLVIPALRVDVQGNALASKALSLTVSKNPTANATSGPELALVRIVAPQRPIYVGETVGLEIHCYYQNAQDAQPPQFAAEGFRLGNPTGPQRAGQVSINGTGYNQVIYHVPVTPIKSGNLKLGPATWSATLLFGRPDFFGRYSESRNETFTSDTPEMQVLALPEGNVPPGFNGAIGTFALETYEASPTTVSAGDPITIKIRISGQGSLDMITLPQDQPEWREFKTYPPTSKTESTDPMQLAGSKYFEQVVTPQNAGIKELPAFTFAFFDPALKAYRTLEHAAVPLVVKPTTATPQPTIIAKEAAPADNAAPAQEIVHIKNELGSLSARSNKPLLQQPGFLVAQALFPLAWLASILWRKQKESLANNPRLRRQREVARLIRDGLKELPALALANKTEDFYATIFRLLQEQLGERLDLPSSAITEAVLEELHPNGINAETLASLRELFQMCNQFRYAPEYKKQELASIIPKVETALKNLQTAKPAKARKAVVQSLAGLALFFTATSIFAQASTPATAFHEANGLYEQAKYPAAAAAYEKIIKENQPNAALYFNLGNAYFKAGQQGRAILAFRQAERLAPRDPDIRANLQFARNQLGTGNSTLSGNRWTRWMNRMTLNEWTLLTSIPLSLFFLLLTARQIFPKTKTALRSLPLPLGIAAGLLLLALTTVASNSFLTQGAVIVVPEAVIRRGPFVESQSVFTARDGAELLVVETQNDWLEVIDSTKRTGWLRQSEVGLVR